MRVAIFEYQASPYRNPVWREMATSHEIHLVRRVGRTADRRWDVDDGGFSVSLWPQVPRGVDRTVFTEFSRRWGSAYLAFVVYTTLVRGPDTYFTSEYFARQGRCSARIRRALLRLIYRRSGGVLAMSEPAYEFVNTLGGVRTCEAWVKQWCPTVWRPIHRQLHLPRRVLYCGRLIAGKGLGVLVDALTVVNRSVPVELWVAGDGPLRASLEAEARKGVYPVRFFGYVEGDAKDEVFAHADLLVLPTEHDAWGMVVNEAIAYGVPFVTTTECGAGRSLLPMEELARPEPSSLADKILDALCAENLWDAKVRELRSSLGHASPRDMATALCQLIERGG